MKKLQTMIFNLKPGKAMDKRSTRQYNDVRSKNREDVKVGQLSIWV